MEIAAIILAAGNASRFGRNKLLVPLQSKPIIEHVMDTVCCFPFVFIAVVSRYQEIQAMVTAKTGTLGFFEGKKIEYVENSEADLGQSSSIRKGVLVAPACDGYLFWPGDQPFVSLQTVEAICLAFEKEPLHIVIPKYGGVPGSPRIFPVHYREELLALTGDRGGRMLVERSDKVTYVSIGNVKEGVDIDTVSDLALWRV